MMDFDKIDITQKFAVLAIAAASSSEGAEIGITHLRLDDLMCYVPIWKRAGLTAITLELERLSREIWQVEDEPPLFKRTCLAAAMNSLEGHMEFAGLKPSGEMLVRAVAKILGLAPQYPFEGWELKGKLKESLKEYGFKNLKEFKKRYLDAEEEYGRKVRDMEQKVEALLLQKANMFRVRFPFSFETPVARGMRLLGCRIFSEPSNDEQRTVAMFFEHRLFVEKLLYNVWYHRFVEETMSETESFEYMMDSTGLSEKKAANLVAEVDEKRMEFPAGPLGAWHIERYLENAGPSGAFVLFIPKPVSVLGELAKLVPGGAQKISCLEENFIVSGVSHEERDLPVIY